MANAAMRGRAASFRSHSLAGIAIAAVLSLTQVARAEDHLKLAVGARGVGETFVAELGQNAGIFKKHGLALDIFYTQGGGETHPGRHLQRRADRRRDRLPRHHRRLRQRRAGAHHRLDLHRRQPVVLVCARRLSDQVAEGRRRQDRGLFDQRLLDPHRRCWR